VGSPPRREEDCSDDSQSNDRCRRLAALALAITPLALGTVDRFTDSWTNEPTEFFQPNACVKKQATGTGVESGTRSRDHVERERARPRETHRHDHLLQALGPGPWDPQPGALIGTWTYDGRFSDQARRTRRAP
jgi:hypothetical protein